MDLNQNKLFRNYKKNKAIYLLLFLSCMSINAQNTTNTGTFANFWNINADRTASSAKLSLLGGGGLLIKDQFDIIMSGPNLKFNFSGYEVNKGIVPYNDLLKLDKNGMLTAKASFFSKNHDAFSGVGNGFRFWGGSDAFKIHMGNTAEYKYGPVTDFSIKTNMSEDTGRGWTWGSHAKVPVAALSNKGDMKIAGNLDAKSLTINGLAAIPNFGQIAAHSTYNNFNTPVKDWGWSYVQGSVNGPNNKSTQWYRHISALGKEYTIDKYRIEIAYPRFNHKEAGVWMRTMENTKLGAWVKISADSGPTLRSEVVSSESGVLGSFRSTSNSWNEIQLTNNSGINNTQVTAVMKVEGNQVEIGSRTNHDLLLTAGDNNDHLRVKTNGSVIVRNNMQIGHVSKPVIDGTKLTVDGRVYISESGGAEIGFKNKTHDTFKNHLLWVEKGIVSADIAIAKIIHWPDYVFKKDYKLLSLKEVEQNIKEKGHLHTMQSAEEIESTGFSVAEMTKNLVRTVEELTLHTIAQEKQINLEKKNNEELLKRLKRLEDFILNKK